MNTAAPIGADPHPLRRSRDASQKLRALHEGSA
jgi:hypothetical protein